MSHVKQNPAMDIAAVVLAEEQENSIAAYEFDGIEQTQAEPVIMRNTLLLTIFRPCSFLILRAKKDGEIEYDEFQARVEMLFAKGIKHNNRTYKVLGGSSSLKDGKVWMATKGVIEAIHSYFGSSQEALAYLGIYTSNCHHGIWEIEHEVKVIDDGYKVNGMLITGDGEGYIPKALFEELSMEEKQIQVRLHGEVWIGKGTLHPYDGDEFIIPKSMIKGKRIPKSGHQYFILGIREVARELKFSSSWTLLQFLSKETDLEIDAEQLQQTISAMQRWLEPPGIAARSVQESLLIQVAELMLIDSQGWSDVQQLIENNFKDLVENKLPQVASSSGISLERVKVAIEKMHELTLSPGRFLATDRVLPVIPDAFIEYDDSQDRYIVGVNDGNLPPLRISSEYKTMAKDQKQDENAKQFIKRNINAAKWIIEAVGQRKKTLGNIVQVVVDKQRDFLDKGDAFLHPLPMLDVAGMLGIHVATVSRAVADKWVQTPRGIFPLRRFFSGGTASNKSGDMSWEAVKHRLQEIVNQEDKKHPFSDEHLAKKLQEQGIEIARRTVVKYRQQLGIPAARLRREY